MPIPKQRRSEKSQPPVFVGVPLLPVSPTPTTTTHLGTVPLHPDSGGFNNAWPSENQCKLSISASPTDGLEGDSGGGVPDGSGIKHALPFEIGYKFTIPAFPLDDWDWEKGLGTFNLPPPFRYECETCLDTDFIWARPCCQVKICQACLRTYVDGKIDEGVIDIQCPGHNCDTKLSARVIKGVVDNTKATRFSFLCVKAGRYKYKKACPMCDYVVTLDDAFLKFYDTLESIITCPNSECLKEWCFQCMVPWHEGKTCGEFKSSRTNTGVDKWAKRLENTDGERNAQQCPSCKVWIQKIVGCYFMTCKECKTNFCYTCGVRTPHPAGSRCVEASTGAHGENPAAVRPAAPRRAAPRHPPRRPAIGRLFGRLEPINQFEIQDPERADLPDRGHRNRLSAKFVALFTTRKCNTMWLRCAVIFVVAFICAIGIISHGLLEAFVWPYND